MVFTYLFLSPQKISITNIGSKLANNAIRKHVHSTGVHEVGLYFSILVFIANCTAGKNFPLVNSVAYGDAGIG
jgi:hypothetical protein